MFFYIPDLYSGEIKTAYSAHLISCRVKIGDTLQVTDLNGSKVDIKISFADSKKGNYKFELLSEIQKYDRQVRQNILIQAKTDKLYLEKLVEIAPLADLDKIIIFDSEFSQKQNINLERLEKILIRSCEQSQKVFKPELEIISQNNKLEEIAQMLKPVVLEGKIPSNQLSNPSTDNLNKVVMIGPEGGWSEKELEIFKKQNLNFENMGEKVYPAWIAGFVWFHKTPTDSGCLKPA